MKMPKTRPDDIPLTRVLRKSLRIAVPLLLLLGLGLYSYVRIDIQHRKELVRAEQTEQVRLSLESLRRDIAGVVPELRYLAHSRSLRQFVDSTDPAQRAAAQHDIAAFTANLGRYDQVRWLSLDGMERLRINHRDGKTEIVPSQALQNKANRYYFIDAVALQPGQIYISPLDLNVENGAVERPFRPMIRIATKTLDSDGIANGLLLFNFQAQPLLQRFAASRQRTTDRLALLNDKGYWLYSPQREREWGFMFGDDKQRFQNVHPQVWQAIHRLGHGSVDEDNGLYTFATVSIKDFVDGSATEHTERSKPENWIVIALYREHPFTEQYLTQLGLAIALLALVVGVIGTVSWKLARARLDRDRAIDRLRLHAKVMESATNGVVITDTQPRIVDINSAFTELTGYQRKDVIGQSPSLLASGRHDRDFYYRMWKTLHEQGYWEGEIWNRHHNGDLFPEWLSINAIRNGNGELVNYIGIFSLLSQQRSTEAALRKLANSDMLTGLINRNLLYDRVGQALAQSRRNSTKTAILFLDLDGFKPVNDQLGHAAGDHVLKVVAQRLRECVRESDTVARFGGDEFVVMLPVVKGRSEILLVVENIRTCIQRPIEWSGDSCTVGASIGISLYPDDGESVEGLIKHADQAMYHAKQQGAGRAEFYHET